MLPTITVQPGQGANWPHQTGLDNETPAQPAAIANRTVSIDNYTDAFVNVDGNQTIFFVPKVGAPQGGSITFNVTMGATDVNGTALPPLVQTIVLMGPPAPPLAVVLAQNAAVTVANTSPFWPGDPGKATVSF